MMMLIAYPIGAIGPLILGAVKDATGSFSSGYAIVWVLGILTFLTIPIFRPGRHIDDHLATTLAGDDDGELPIPPV
jgi:cyanate permease